MNNDFLITIHDYDYESEERRWMDIEDFIETKGLQYIDEYFDI